jgi:hypothetical protein
MSNVEGMYSNYFIKRLSAAKPPFVILRFDIRYSAVRCSVRVVSYEVSGVSNYKVSYRGDKK